MLVPQTPFASETDTAVLIVREYTSSHQVEQRHTDELRVGTGSVWPRQRIIITQSHVEHQIRVQRRNRDSVWLFTALDLHLQWFTRLEGIRSGDI